MVRIGLQEGLYSGDKWTYVSNSATLSSNEVQICVGETSNNHTLGGRKWANF